MSPLVTAGAEVSIYDRRFLIGDTPITLKRGTVLRFNPLWVRQYSETGVGMTVSVPPDARLVTFQRRRIGRRRGLLRLRPRQWGFVLPAHDEETSWGKLHHAETFVPLSGVSRATRSWAVIVSVPS